MNQLFANCVPLESEMKKSTRYNWLPTTWILQKRNRAPQYAFYLTGRKTGNVAKSSELSAERWQCQATLDQMAEQNKQKTMKTGLRLEQNHTPKY